MTKAPETYRPVVEFGIAEMKPHEKGEWMPVDHALALVGTALRKAVHAVDTAYANGETGNPGHHIHPLIHGDAQAALERRDARIRNEALAEAWTIADQNGDVETASALQRLITEDQSDG